MNLNKANQGKHADTSFIFIPRLNKEPLELKN